MGVIVGLDHNQLEPRVQAHIYSLLGDESWANVYHFGLEWERGHLGVYNPKADIYAVIGSMAFRYPLKDITHKKHPIRKKSKPIVLGMSYGLTKYGLAYRLNCTEDEADAVIKQLFRSCPGMASYFRLTRDEVIENEEVVSMFGKVRHLPFDRKDIWSYRRAFRQAVNHKIQVPASDLTLSGIVDYEEKYRGLCMLPRKHGVVLAAEVHDNGTYDGRTAAFVPTLKWHMEHPSILKDYGLKFRVPLQADVTIGKTWD